MSRPSKKLASVGFTLGLCACTAFGAAKDPAASPPNDDDGGTTTDAATAVEDGGAHADATTDGGPPARSCRGGDELCADFDGPNSGEWNDTAKVDDNSPLTGAVLAEVDGAGVGGSRALRSFLPAGEDDGPVARRFSRDGLVDFRVEADIYMETPTLKLTAPTGAVTVLKLAYGSQSNNPTAEVKIVAGPTSGDVLMFARTTSGHQQLLGDQSGIRSMPYDTWVHVTVEAHLVVGGGAKQQGFASVSTDTGAAITLNFTRVQGTAVQPVQTQAAVGLQRYTATTASDLAIRVDNVVGTVMP